MPSNDLIPNYPPPSGGLTKLMHRIDEAQSFRQNVGRRNFLYGGLLVGGLAAALAVILLPRSSPTLADLVRGSDALHLYKYGLKSMPAEGVRLEGPQGAVTLRKADFGYRSDEGPL